MILNGGMGKRFQHYIQQNLASGLVINFRPQFFAHIQGRTATEMIPTIEMIPASEMTCNHHRNDPLHRNDTYSLSNCSRHKFSEPRLKWTWDFAIILRLFMDTRF